MKIKAILLYFVLIIFFSCDNREKAVSINNSQKSSFSKTTPLHIHNQNSKSIDIEYSSEQLDNNKGLSNSSINTIFQDSDNLLWIGTWDGLNRYDGSNFKIYRPEANNENSLSNQVILKIDEDSNGNIWIVTIHGINRFDKKTGTFQRYYFSRKDISPLSESEFNMALDSSKRVFCAAKNWGIGY
ncbi:two-component regulator propeller domain-containing protein, partial [uncultured Flavobacterium sp.]|uniref:ligand-binding sensor domain-containing protein n=1 Tax=uncultured Flavobacterium sp. TaxID=165435 RepID=UPI00292EC948